MNDIINEINQDLRHERWKALWKKYAVYVIGFAVAVVVLVAGRQGVVAYQERQRLEAAQQYFVAVNANSTNALRAIADQGGEGYPMLARFAEAGRLAEADNPAAEEVYLALARDETLAEPYRDAALVMSVMNAGVHVSVDERINRIAGLASSDRAWQLIASEILIGLYLEKGDLAAARTQLEGLRLGQNITAETNQRILLLESALAE